jgi:hypothetical protein
MRSRSAGGRARRRSRTLRRKLLALAALLGGAFAGFALFRRAGGGRRERVDLYYEDGSLVSLNELEGATLLDIARDALRA